MQGFQSDNKNFELNSGVSDKRGKGIRKIKGGPRRQKRNKKKERETDVAVCRQMALRDSSWFNKRQVLNYDQGQLPRFLAWPH